VAANKIVPGHCMCMLHDDQKSVLTSLLPAHYYLKKYIMHSKVHVQRLVLLINHASTIDQIAFNNQTYDILTAKIYISSWQYVFNATMRAIHCQVASTNSPHQNYLHDTIITITVVEWTQWSIKWKPGLLPYVLLHVETVSPNGIEVWPPITFQEPLTLIKS